MAVFGTELAPNLSMSEGSKEGGQLCLNESFLRELGMRIVWKSKEMNSRQGGKACCTKTQEISFGKIGGSEVLCLL
jgi:hypothetical protein